MKALTPDVFWIFRPAHSFDLYLNKKKKAKKSARFLLQRASVVMWIGLSRGAEYDKRLCLRWIMSVWERERE